MKRTTQEDYQRRIWLAQEYIVNHLDSELRPLEVAKASGFSQHHFHRIFRGVTGESMMGFTRRLRLERGARLLRSSERSVLDIALQAGYSSHEAFSRAFRELFQIAPKNFRESSLLRKSRTNVLCLENAGASPLLEVTIQKKSSQDCIFMQHTGSYLEVGVLWQAFFSWIDTHACSVRLDDDGHPLMYALVPDDPDITPQERLRYQACFLTSNDAPIADGPVARTCLPGGQYAVVVHTGPYERLHESYLDLIGRWFPQSGYQPADSPVIEHYLNSPQDTQTTDLKTEIRVLIS